MTVSLAFESHVVRGSGPPQRRPRLLDQNPEDFVCGKMPGKAKKRSAPKGEKAASSSSSSSSSSGASKRRKVGKVGSGRAAAAAAAAEARSKRAISHLGESGVVSSQRPSDQRLEIGATAEAVACDNQNVTKKAGKGKVRHLFVLPGHLDLLKFASSVRVKKKPKSGVGKPQETGATALVDPAGGAAGGAEDHSSASPRGATGATGAAGAAGAAAGGSKSQSGRPVNASSPVGSSAQDVRSTMNSFGAVAELGSGKPVLYIDVPARGGRIKLCGTIVYPDAPLLTLQLPPASSKSNNIVCDNVFDNMVVFDNVSWVPNKVAPASSPELKLELDEADLHKEREKFTGRRLQQKDDTE